MFEALATQLKLPDLWQHQAVDYLRAGKDVIVDAPTGAGKTYIFELLHESKCLNGQAVYTVPTRALANDKFAEWKQRGWDVGIATGDVSENIHAPVLVATLETQLERLLRGEGPACLVIDEYQMISDTARGASYEGAVALCGTETTLLLLSGSVANPNEVADWMRRLEREVEVVTTKHRPVPLDEMPFEALPQAHGRSFQGWWSKLVASVLMADLAPLLIFTPRRKDAQGIARTLANELPPGDPLHLTPEQKAVCGKELSLLVEKRIAYHHSGLSYAARAGVIEPLAKAGQLRAIVATMGLAAGINFSVRSVHVAATKFHDGITEHSLDPDELLQMFGRAGRRGLDERGYVITSKLSPTLHDARPARLTRSGVLAWSMFLRVMKHAALRNDAPFAAAAKFAERLFAKAPPPLGIEAAEPVNPAMPRVPVRDGRAIFDLEATEEQIINGAGRWETAQSRRNVRTTLGRCWLANETRQGPALRDSKFVLAQSKGLARVFKSDHGYGLEIALGPPIAEDATVFKPTKTLRKLLGLTRAVEDVSCDEFLRRHQTKIARKLAPEIARYKAAQPEPNELPVFIGLVQREGLILARYDLHLVPVDAYEDQAGCLLLQPQRRVMRRESATSIVMEPSVAEPKNYDPRPGSAIHSWRALGLIDSHGVPTRRGEIVSFFQHGEGLAIAAALEDTSYAISDLVLHTANLRAGFRFEQAGYCESERLGAVCRQVYGFVSHEGYLINGLPVDYGEGACEVMDALIHRDRRSAYVTPEGFAEGDVSRAYIEWISLLRHIVNAPSHPWTRWEDLQKESEKALKQHSKVLRHLFHIDLPPLTTKQRSGKVKHWLGKW